MQKKTQKPPEKKTDQRFPFLKTLGPGLITGASDDDPSGIGTYSQAGAQFGFATGWTMLLTFPLMAAIQEISARSAERRATVWLGICVRHARHGSSIQSPFCSSSPTPSMSALI